MSEQQDRKTQRQGPATILGRIAIIDRAVTAGRQGAHLSRSQNETDLPRLGGDESKLLKHYGLSRNELISAERNPARLLSSSAKRGTMLSKPVASMDDLQNIRSRSSIASDKREYAPPIYPSQQDYSPSPRRRETKKFSIRKVFGRSDQDALRPRDSMTLRRDSLDQNATYTMQGAQTKREILPSTRRRLSVENRCHSPAVRSPPRSTRDDFLGEYDNPWLKAMSTPVNHDMSSAFASPNGPQSAPTWVARSSHSIEAFPTSKNRPRSTSNALKFRSCLDRPDLLDDAQGLSLPLHGYTLDTQSPMEIAAHQLGLNSIPRPMSMDSGSNSDEKRTLRADSVGHHFVSGEACLPEMPFSDWPVQTCTIPTLGDWTSTTISRQAMEVASFFARLSELESRLAAFERVLAKIPARDVEHHTISRDCQNKNSTMLHRSGSARLCAFHSATITESYLTPPASQLSENPEPVSETWLDGNSSVSSSYADSILASSPWLSSRTSAEVPKRSPALPSMSSFSSEKRSTHTTKPSSTPSAVAPLGKMPASVSTVPSTLAQEIEAMHCEMSSLRSQTTHPSSAFSKFSSPTYTREHPDHTDRIPFNATHERNERNETETTLLTPGTSSGKQQAMAASVIDKDIAIGRNHCDTMDIPMQERTSMWRDSLSVSTDAGFTPFGR